MPPAPLATRVSRSPSRSRLSSLSPLELSPAAAGAGLAAAASRALASSSACFEMSSGKGLSSAVDFLGCCAESGAGCEAGVSPGLAGGGHVLLAFHGPLSPRVACPLQPLSGCVEGACGGGGGEA